MNLNQRQLTVRDAYDIMSKCALLVAEGKLSEKESDQAQDLLILIETVIIGLLYLEYPAVVMDKVGPVIKEAISRVQSSYEKEKGKADTSDFYSYFMRNSYRNGIYSSLSVEPITEDDGKKFSDKAVTMLMEIGKELGDKPSRYCASVVYGIFASSVKGAGGAVAYDQNGKPASEDLLLQGIASQSAAGILAYKSFLMDVAASEGVTVEGKRFKAACMDNDFKFTNGSNCAQYVSDRLSLHTMDSLIESSDKFASLSLGIAESASFKSSFELEKGIKDKIDAYSKECGDDREKLSKKLEGDPEISNLAEEVEKRFDAYAHDPKTNASKASSVFASAAYDILSRVRSVLVTSKE